MAVEEPPLLLAVQRVVGRVQVQDDLPRSAPVRLQEHFHQHPVHRRLVQDDLLVAAVRSGVRPSQLQAVQGALAGQGLPHISRPQPLRPRRVPLAHQGRQQRVGAQLVVVVQVFVPQCQPVHALRHQVIDRVLDRQRIPMVDKTPRELPQDPGSPLHLPQQHPAPIRGDRPSVEPGLDVTTR